MLSEFRARLIDRHAEERELPKMLALFQQKGWLKARGRQRTDSTHVLAKIRALNRVLCVWETMRAALNSLAVVAPDWLRAHSQSEGGERYGLAPVKIRVLLEGKPSAWHLLRRSDSTEENSLMPSLIQQPLSGSALFRQSRILRQVWVQNSQRIDDTERPAFV